MNCRHIFRPTLVTRATAYDEQTDPPEDENTLVIPDADGLAALSADDLEALHTQARDAFEAIYQGGQATLTREDLTTLQGLTEGIQALAAEVTRRHEDQAQVQAEAAEMAAAINDAEDAPEGDAPEDEDGEVDPDAPEEQSGEPEGEVAEEEVPAAIAASGRRQTLRVNIPAVRSHQAVPRRGQVEARREMRDLVFAAPNLDGFRDGQGMTWTDMGRAVDSILRSYDHRSYQSAAARGVKMQQKFGVVTIQKPFTPDLIINSGDPEHVETVLARAADETRLPNGALVASGGWCPPSEVIYDLCELESRDGLYDLPEAMIRRGGIQHALGPDFSSLFNNTGFTYTEAEDIAGDYDGAGGGSKPCFKVECPDFVDDRLDLAGLCITAGLLQSRGYPEAIARTMRGALIAHDHRVASLVLSAVAAGSTAVSMPASQVGATAPILTAVGLQVEHYRDVNRLARSRTLEAVFPFWTREAIRADLARRQGVDLLSVPDSRIDAWFRERNVNPQYVYNWQGLSDGTPASGATSFPTEVDFLLYTAGTWVRGSSDVITLDTIYDSTLLGENDYTALFSEEGWLVAKRCHDSRVVTVPICPDGATHIGVAIDCDGSEGA